MDAPTLFDHFAPESRGAERVCAQADEQSPRGRWHEKQAPQASGCHKPDRARVMELILEVNQGVAREFLDQFEDAPLRAYLAHLESGSRPRGRGAGWARPAGAGALVGRDSQV